MKDRVVVVTGGGRGIGQAIAARLADLGARTVVNDVDGDAAERAAAGIRATGGCADVSVADVTCPETVDAMMAEIAERHGAVDILVNNAGIGPNAAIARTSDAMWSDVLGINMTGVFRCCRAVIGPMKEQGFGRIVNISSRAWLGWYGQVAYAASKGAVVSLTRSLAIEVARHGITVNAIAPGLIQTPLLETLSEEQYDRLLSAQPSGVVGSPDDVAWATGYLASDEARFVTGQLLYVCGGKSLYAEPRH